MALFLIVCADRSVVSSHFPWPALVSRVQPEQSVYWGVTRDRAELQRAAQTEGRRPSVAVLGSSRGQTGFRREVAEGEMPEVVFAELSHALQDPVTVHALVPEIIDAGIDVAVLTMSHVDTHRPIRLEPLPAKSTSRLATIAAVSRHAGPDVVGAHRESLYRIAGSRLSNLYRFRDNLGRAGFNALREFPLDRRLQGRLEIKQQGETVIGEAAPMRLPSRIESALLSHVPESQRRWVYQLAWFAEVRNGEHADLHMALLKDAVEQLNDAGVRVVIAECPAHEIGKRLEEPGAEAQFRGFAEGLAQRSDVWFVSLSNVPAYEADDYSDLFHLNETGGARFTRSILRALSEVFATTYSTIETAG